MDDHIIIGVHVSNRAQQAVELQKIFTEFGCSIKTRVGLHDTDANVCATTGVILLEIFNKDGEDKSIEMLDRFNAIDGIDAQKMRFEH